MLNWRLAGNSVDYLASENASSPAQHFWSLSVEEQFYLIWPVLILGLMLWALRHRRDQLRTAFAGLGVVVAASLAYSIYATTLEPAQAYFVTPTRIWELNIGGILAVSLARRARDKRGFPAGSAPAYVRVILTLIGLGGVIAFFDNITPPRPTPKASHRSSPTPSAEPAPRQPGVSPHTVIFGTQPSDFAIRRQPCPSTWHSSAWATLAFPSHSKPANPDNPTYGIENTPKVVGGHMPACTEKAQF